MEAVAAVSSVAGIASLVGQSLNGLKNLSNFVHDCRNASRTVTRFLEELTTLKQTIEEVDALLLQIKEPFEDSRRNILNSLSTQLEQCANNLQRWLVAAQNNKMSHRPSYKRLFQSILISIRSQDIKDVFRQISSHREGISLSLSATGRLLDLEHLRKSDFLLSKVDEVAVNSKLTVNALSRLENRFDHSPLPAHRPSTPQDLSDISSQLSRIESLICSGYSASSVNESSVDYLSPAGHGPSLSSGEQSTGSPMQLRWANSSLKSDSGEPEATRQSSRNEAFHMRASFVGHSPLLPRRFFTCECCGTSPNTFESLEELKVHEETLPWPCQYCRHRSSNNDELELHVDAWHYGHISWSCANMNGWQAAFPGSVTDRSSDLCCYCGEVFQRSGPGVLTKQDWLDRTAHLRKSHKFECCDRTERFLLVSKFRDHLKNNHDATIGDWTEKLFDACVVKITAEETYQNSQYNETVATIFQEEGRPGSAWEIPFGTIDVKDYILDKYGALLVGIGHSGCPKDVVQYVRLRHLLERKYSNKLLLEVFLKKIEVNSKPAFREITNAKKDLESGLAVLEAGLERARLACWKQGFDLDFVEDFIPSRKPNKEDNEGCCEHLAIMWNEILHDQETHALSTKRGRINCWLLQNLIASPEESARHRAYLQNGQPMGEVQWVRLVLEFWLIDEAAVGVESRSSSTNGAVDSDGRCHSDRVLLEGLSLRRRRELHTDDDSSDILEPRKKARVCVNTDCV
ncbi:hypothetical protein N431DRAFT_324530 [Stipitochalara longipes BDJ]|nr:hypothetical protein N431DRAFT_324530 [Stipitochalara longipes BDJ]